MKPFTFVYTFPLRMTALFLIIMGVNFERFGLVNLTIMAIATCMLLGDCILKDRRAWIALLAVLLFLLYTQWHHSENNRFLLIYWVLAIVICLSEKKQEEALTWNARMLIGLAFASAFLHKLLMGEYLNGSFFENTLLSDPRLKNVCVLLGGLAKETVINHYKMLDIMYLFPGSSIISEFTTTTKLKAIGIFLSYWTLIIEFLIAFSFLALPLKKISTIRDFFLITFIATTYLITPVPRFGMVLCIMGLTQCSPTHPIRRNLYLALFILQPFTLLMSSKIWSVLP